MDYWTIMLVTILGGPLSDAQFVIPYPSLESCEAAAQDVSGTLPYDHNMICVEGDTPSGSIRPEPRP